MTRNDLLTVLPELILLCGASVILLVDVLLSDARRHVSFWLTQITLFLCALATLATTQVNPVWVFHGLVVNDLTGGLLKFFNYVTIASMLFFSREYLEAR